MPEEFTVEDFATKAKDEFSLDDFKPKAAPSPEETAAFALQQGTEIPSRVMSTLTNPAVSAMAGEARTEGAKVRSQNAFERAQSAASDRGIFLAPRESYAKAADALMAPVRWAVSPIEPPKAPPMPPDLQAQAEEEMKKVAPTLARVEAGQRAFESSLPASVKIMEGATQSLVPLVKSFISPVGIATLGMEGLPVAAQRIISGGFAAQMASQTPELARELGEEVGKPESQRDTTKIARIITEAATALGFTTLAARHAATPEATKAEVLAKMLSDSVKASPSLDRYKEQVAQRPNVGVKERTVEIPPRPPEAGQLYEGLEPSRVIEPPAVTPEAPKPEVKTEAQNQLADYDRYNELVNALKDAPLEQRFKMTQEIEDIKNRHGKMPPKKPAEAALPEAPPATGDPDSLVAAIRTKDGNVIPGKDREVHDDIWKAQNDDWLADNLGTKEHGFWDGKKFLTRREAADLLGEKEDLHSQRLNELKDEKAKRKGKAAEAVTPEQPPVESATAGSVDKEVEPWIKVDVTDSPESREAAKFASRQLSELNKQRGELEAKIKEAAKLVISSRGWQKGRIKSSAKKSDVAAYQDLQQKLRDVNQSSDAIRRASQKDSDTVEMANLGSIVNDPNKPLIMRLGARARMFATEQKAPPFDFSKAFEAETKKEILKRIPDATPEEIKHLINETQRSAMLQTPLDAEFQHNPAFDIFKRRRDTLENVAFSFQAPYHDFSPELKQRIGKYTTTERPSNLYSTPIEKLPTAELESIKKSIAQETEKIRKEAAERAAKAEADAKIEADKNLKLVEEAQKAADSAKRSGTEGGRSEKAVKEELITKTKGVIDDTIEKSGTKLVRRDPDQKYDSEDGVEYFAESNDSGASAMGVIKKTESGSYHVRTWRLGDKDTAISFTFKTIEEAEWAIKAMASTAPGKAIFGVPGDGVFQLNRTGHTLLRVFKGVKGMDTGTVAVEVPMRRETNEQIKRREEARMAELKAAAARESAKPQPGDALKDFTEVGPGGETALASYHNTPSGLPPGVPDGGPTFPAELLEASRRLGTLVRSRTTLPPGVGGWYIKRRAAVAQSDMIEVGHLKNQLTVAHEMGHDLDDLLFPAQMLAKTEKSLAARVGTGTGKELKAELIPISELMRGKITGSKGHQSYRRSATELIADFFALYAHDPERARSMAPKFAKGFEDALARNPNAQEVIRQLHAKNVEPIPAKTLVGPTGKGIKMPGAVPQRGPDPIVNRDRVIAAASQDLVKSQVRQYEAEVQRATLQADKWREQVPSQEDRNDAGAFVEGTGNIEKPNDTIADVTKRMTPAKFELVKAYRFAIEHARERLNYYLKGTTDGEYLKFLEDYLPHFYANSNTAQGRSGLARFIKDSPNAKQRKIPTLQEASEYGLIPITQDPAVLFEHHARINWRVATNRQVLEQLKNMKTTGGDPVIVPAKDAPPGWHVTDNPLIQRTYARQTPNGVLVWKGGAAVHPDAWRAVRMILEQPTSSDLGRAYDALNSITRANAFAFSLFHDITLRAASLGAQARWYNPLRGIFRLFERDPITGEMKVFQTTRGIGKQLQKDEETLTDAALHGLKFSWTESESYQHNARDWLEKAAARWREVPVLGTSARLARDIQAMRQKGLWKNTHDALKLAAYQDMTAKALQNAPPGTSPKAVKESVASLLNDAFGGQEWETKFWLSPQTRKVLSRFFLAPDWTFSTLRSVPFVSDAASTVFGNAPRAIGRDALTTQKEGLPGNLGRLRFWGGELAGLAMATIGAQYAIYSAFGDRKKGDREWIWENEHGQNRRIDVTPLMRQLPWHDPKDPTRYYVNLGKRPEEILGWFTHPEENVMSKVARPVAEVMRQITGTEGDFKAQWKRDHETFMESIPSRLKSAAGQFIPFTFSGNQFALSLPYRKGMNKYKAQQAYESAYEIAANPGSFPGLRAQMRGVPAPEGSLQKMVAEITDAAKRNGVPTEAVRKRALSTVRGEHYDKFFKAYQKGDKVKMLEEAQALQRLGATQGQIDNSVERRKALLPHLPN